MGSFYTDDKFNINGEEIKISNEDVLFIEKDTLYSFEGNFKAVRINIPVFGMENDRSKK